MIIQGSGDDSDMGMMMRSNGLNMDGAQYSKQQNMYGCMWSVVCVVYQEVLVLSSTSTTTGSRVVQLYWSTTSTGSPLLAGKSPCISTTVLVPGTGTMVPVCLR